MTVLPEVVQAGGHVPERLPTEHADRLIGHRDVGEVVGVDEDVAVGLVEVQAALQELVVLVGDQREIPAWPVRVERRRVPMSRSQ